MCGGDFFDLANEFLESVYVVVANLQSAVDKELGNIVVAGKHTANEAVKLIGIVNAVFLGIYKTCVIFDIEGELSAAFDADNNTVGFFGSRVNRVDKGFGFARAF